MATDRDRIEKIQTENAGREIILNIPHNMWGQINELCYVALKPLDDVKRLEAERDRLREVIVKTRADIQEAEEMACSSIEKLLCNRMLNRLNRRAACELDAAAEAVEGREYDA